MSTLAAVVVAAVAVAVAEAAVVPERKRKGVV
jgi:hypothetical protein